MKRAFQLLTLSAAFLLIQHLASAQEMLNDHMLKLTQASNDQSYGFNENNPIKVGKKPGAVEYGRYYLNALRGPKGEKVQYRRLGSCCAFKTKNAIFGNAAVLDKYEVYHSGMARPREIFINCYDPSKPQALRGFSFHTEATIPAPQIYPEEKIVKVNACNARALYAVDDPLLKEHLDEKLTPPTTNPTYKNEELMDIYFSSNPLTDNRATSIVFKASIGFVVNCKGKAGNYQIVSKGTGELADLANQILGIVNGLKNDWTAATLNGRYVDSYQVLHFTIIEGSLAKVAYR